MAKVKTLFKCQNCGYSSPKWLGKCPDCNQWNSFVEETVMGTKSSGFKMIESSAPPSPITEIGSGSEERIPTGISEFDRVLGGGVVIGSAILIGGEPGIGKSTILLQAMASLAESGKKVLYVSGEESTKQIKLRGERLGGLSENLYLWSETSLEKIIDSINNMKPDILVIDSIQTLYSSQIESSPGSVSQVRDSTGRLVNVSKGQDIPVFIVGHVTKDGSIAGPKVVEHMVDTVLYFEGEKGHNFRILRAVKNRYGSVMEIGVFEMGDSGLREVLNPSEVFLTDRAKGASGSAVVASLEGTRTILIEIQSLVCQSILGVPRRVVEGMDYNKVLLLIAVLEKKAGIILSNQDVFMKVAGGMKLDEPAVDLAIAVSVASNFYDVAIEPGTIIFGEVGLAGEVRSVNQSIQRVKEATKLGFTKIIMPLESVKVVGKVKGVELKGVSTVNEAFDIIFPNVRS